MVSAILALTRRTSSANGTGCDPQLIRRQLTLLRIDRLHARRAHNYAC